MCAHLLSLEIGGEVHGEEIGIANVAGNEAHLLIGGGDELRAEERGAVVLLVTARPRLKQLHWRLLVRPPFHLRAHAHAHALLLKCCVKKINLTFNCVLFVKW